MQRKILGISFFLFLMFALFGCNSLVSQATEATASPPVVTSRLTSIIASVAPLYQVTNTWDPKTATPILPTPTPIDTGYYEGVIIITQYYTFLGHGLYEEAYQLLGSSARVHSLNKYMDAAKQAFKKVDIITIEPFHIAAKKWGGSRIRHDE